MATMGDIVLIYQEESPVFFARIEDIWADRKPDWFNVKLLILNVPLVEVVWILRETYINGEPFTMKGMKLRLEEVKSPGVEKSPQLEMGPEKKAEGGDNKVVNLFDRKKG